MPAEHIEISAGPIDEPEAHTCGCGDSAEEAVLDARQIPHEVRHGAVRGAFSSIPVGGSMVLVAPHNPLPLLAQIRSDAEDALEVTYLQDTPGECRVRLTRTEAP